MPCQDHTVTLHWDSQNHYYLLLRSHRGKKLAKASQPGGSLCPVHKQVVFRGANSAASQTDSVLVGTLRVFSLSENQVTAHCH